jgi:hypothetical protein
MPIRQRLRSLLWRVPVEQEVHDELAHHAELRARDLVDRGVDPAAARAEAEARAARAEAELARLGRARNDAWARREWLDELQQDLTFALRQCRTHRGFTAAAVLTLAIGIGATTAIFSVVHAVVLKPYAYPDPDRVLLTFSLVRGNRGSWSVGNFHYFDQRLTTTTHFAAAAGTSLNLADDGARRGKAGHARFLPALRHRAVARAGVHAGRGSAGPHQRGRAQSPAVAAPLQRRSGNGRPRHSHER